MEEKYFLDEKGLESLGDFLWEYYAIRDRHDKDFLQIDHRLVNLEHAKVLPDDTNIRDIKKDGLYIINAITAEHSPVKEEFTDYQFAETRGIEWQFPSYYIPYALLQVTHRGNDILYFLFDPIFSKIHCAVYNSKSDSLRWQAEVLGFSLRSSILDLINQMFYSNPDLNHVVDGTFFDGWNLSSPYIQNVTFNYNTDNITAKVTSMVDAGQPEAREEDAEGVFLLGATENSAGVMSASDKKKLNSIDVEKYEQQDNDIKSMQEEITLLKSQIEKLQSSLNGKE